MSEMQYTFFAKCLISYEMIDPAFTMGLSMLRGHNWVHFAHRLQCTLTMNSNFAILKTRNCFQLD